MSDSFERLIPYAGQALGLSTDDLARAFRPATEADVPAILALRRAVTAEMWWDDGAYLHWRYFGGRTDAEPPYWIAVKDGTVLGACGLEPVTLSVDGRTHSAVRSLDMMVRPDLDGQGLGAFMNLMLFRRFPIMLVTGFNESSRHLISRMFDHGADLVFWKMVTSGEVVRQRLYSGPFSRVIAGAAGRLLALMRQQRGVWRPRGVHLREIYRFDDRVTTLSARCERLGRIVVRRSAEYLNWRFLQNPRCRYRAFAAFTGDRLDGYVVTRLNLVRPNPRREGDVVDWMAVGEPDDLHSVLPALLARAVDALVHDGAGLITCAAFGADVERSAQANGFHLREDRIPFFVRAAEPGMQRRLASGNGWFLTRGDLDVE